MLLNDVKTQSLVSVEMLISAIKSGELVKEQENSNKRIQDILLSILDEKTLQMFDNLFNEDKNDEAIDEEDEVLNLGIINEQPENMTQNSTLNQSQLSERQPTANSFRAESNRNMSGLFLESERLLNPKKNSFYLYQKNIFSSLTNCIRISFIDFIIM